MLNIAVIADQKSLKTFWGFYETNKKRIEKLIDQKIKINCIFTESDKIQLPDLLRDQPIKIYQDYSQLLLNSELDVIIELNKNEKTFFYLKSALQNNKIFITASSRVIAENYSRIKQLEKENQSRVYFSAAFSPLPIHTLINDFYAVDGIKELNAVLNATTNYILTEMAKSTVSMKETIEQAKELSYAEENPELDLDGYDSLYKITLLGDLIYETALNPEVVNARGIKGITSYDLIYAEELGYKIKLICTIKKENGNLYIGVRPNLISEDSFLASVNENSNAVEVFSDFNARTIFKAENCETAINNLFCLDLINTANFINKRNKGNFNYHQYDFNFFDLYTSQQNPFYIRLQIEKDREIIKEIKNIFSEENLAELVLHDNLTETPLLPVIIITRKIKEKNLEILIEKIEKLEGVLTVNNIIPVRAE
ncbi:MAG: homoserine dehydrogenase [Halanaerobium sp.]